jgi:hypothetical protein
LNDLDAFPAPHLDGNSAIDAGMTSDPEHTRIFRSVVAQRGFAVLAGPPMHRP